MADLVRIEGVNLEGAEGRVVFQDLDWNLPLGGRARIHAPSGGGATALLRLCAGLADPRAGRVVLDGVPLTPHAFAHPFLKRGGIGWIPKEGGLLVNLNLLANVALPLRFLRGHTRARAEEIALAWLESIGLGARAFDRPHALEPWECWLGALVRAAAAEPNLWLLNLPPASLDPEARAHATRLLRLAAANPETSFIIIGGADDHEVEASEFRIKNGQVVRGGAS